jgi:hypothetical protein
MQVMHNKSTILVSFFTKFTIVAHLCLATFIFPAIGREVKKSSNPIASIEALCSIANAYATCHAQFKKKRLIINFPTKLIVLTPSEIEKVEIVDSRRRELIRLFQNVGDVDFLIYFNQNGMSQVGAVRFKNNASALKFNESLEQFRSSSE